MKRYKLVNSYPVARFYYKGGHSHPIQRTVLLTESTDSRITGYEVRAGKIVRQPNNAPIKSYLRKKIARVKSLKASMKRNALIISNGPMVTTLKRTRLHDYLFVGP
jgi:hypothetical protein